MKNLLNDDVNNDFKDVTVKSLVSHVSKAEQLKLLINSIDMVKEVVMKAYELNECEEAEQIIQDELDYGVDEPFFNAVTKLLFVMVMEDLGCDISRFYKLGALASKVNKAIDKMFDVGPDDLD